MAEASLYITVQHCTPGLWRALCLANHRLSQFLSPAPPAFLEKSKLKSWQFETLKNKQSLSQIFSLSLNESKCLYPFFRFRSVDLGIDLGYKYLILWIFIEWSGSYGRTQYHTLQPGQALDKTGPATRFIPLFWEKKPLWFILKDFSHVRDFSYTERNFLTLYVVSLVLKGNDLWSSLV